MRELNGGVPQWSFETYINADIANSLRILCWQNTRNGEKGVKIPPMIQPEKQAKKEERYTSDQIDEILKRKRV